MGFSYTCMSIGHSYNGDVKSLSHRLSVQAKKTNKQTNTTTINRGETMRPLYQNSGQSELNEQRKRTQ